MKRQSSPPSAPSNKEQAPRTLPPSSRVQLELDQYPAEVLEAALRILRERRLAKQEERA